MCQTHDSNAFEPLDKPAQDTSDKEASKVALGSLPEYNRAKGAYARMANVLTVEDNPTTRAIIAAALRERGHIVFEAENGKVALTILPKQKIDLVLLDIHMPVMDGPTMLIEMRKTQPKLPVVLLSGKRDMDRIKDCMDLGALQYLHKPVDINVLHEVITDIAGEGNTEAVSAHWGTMMLVSPDDAARGRMEEFMPSPITLELCPNMRSATEASARHRLRTIIVDEACPGGAAKTMENLRQNQAEAVFIALYPGNFPEPAETAWSDGFDGFLSKPLTLEPVEYLLALVGFYHFELESILDVDEGFLTPLPYDGFHASVDRYYSHLAEKVGLCLQDLGEEGYEEVILDCSELPDSPLRLTLAQTAIAYCAELDIAIRLVGDKEMWKAAQGASSGAVVQVFNSVDEALDED